MIYVNGDSWSYAIDVNDRSIWPNSNTDIKKWPNILSKNLGHEVLNESMGCGSNSRILDCVENILLETQSPKLVILALTSHQRWHLPSKRKGHWCISPLVAIDDHTGEKDEFIQKWFYAKSFDYLDSIYRYYKIIWSCSNICQKIGSKFLIFQAWDQGLANLNVLESPDSIRNFVLDFFDNKNDVIAEKYIRAFNYLRKNQHSWNYITSTFASLLVPEDYDDTGHPNTQGHHKIEEFVYSTLTAKFDLEKLLS